VEYHFEQQERFKIEVYDADDDKNLNNLANQEFLGGLEFQLHEVVTCIDQTLKKALPHPKMTTKAII
jgi:hypothetical protein